VINAWAILNYWGARSRAAPKSTPMGGGLVKCRHVRIGKRPCGRPQAGTLLFQLALETLPMGDAY